MLRARFANEWLHTNMTPEEIAERDWLWTEVLTSVARGMNPPKVE
jgi:hypothetical protein